MGAYDGLYDGYLQKMDALIAEDGFFADFIKALKAGKNTFEMTRKTLEKQIDEGWVTAIESALIPLDNAIRHPRKFIKQEEEILPIELSHNITAESVRHLAQHTNLISSVEGDTITPSKILNVIKEESLETYENKFLNTLIDRLYIFVYKRYQKLREQAQDEVHATLTYTGDMRTPSGGAVSFSLEIQTKDPMKAGEGSDDLWGRVEKIKQVVDGYKGSAFVQTMKGLYIRPPVMRTNAILKDPDLKQCLLLWQYIESYDKVGYEMRVTESAQKPGDEYIANLYELAALQYLLFRRQTAGEEQPETFKSRQSKRPVAPKFVKTVERQMVDEYNFHEVEFLKTMGIDPLRNRRKLSEDEVRIRQAVGNALADEKRRKAEAAARIRELERQRLEKERLAEAQRLEKQRLAEERERERERIAEERRIRREEEETEKARREEERRLAAEQRAREAEQRRILREQQAAEKARRESEEALARLKARLEERARESEEAAGRLLEQRRAARQEGREDSWGARRGGWKNGR